MQQLGLEYRMGTELTKQVFIRDEAAEHLSDCIIPMRLHPGEVGIHPGNRDTEKIVSSGVYVRGDKIIASGFSHAAMGKLYAFEDHPTKRHIAKYTVECTRSDELGSYDLSSVKVGPGNCTHTNQFAQAVDCRAKCSHPRIPCIDGRIDREKILQDPRNIRLKQYIEKGVIWYVFPHWVEELYPWMPKLFQSASNQEQQVQEGTGSSIV